MFFLAGAIAGPVIGRWSDFIGRRAALLLVLGIMGAGTILCITAPTLELLVTGRFLQGVSSAVFALAYIVLSENLQAKVFGTSVGIIAAINGGIGGVDGWVGGLMAKTLGFRSIFVVVLVLTAVAACASFGRPAGARGVMVCWGFGDHGAAELYVGAEFGLAEDHGAGSSEAVADGQAIREYNARRSGEPGWARPRLLPLAVFY